jgi:hypothetical protein
LELRWALMLEALCVRCRMVETRTPSSKSPEKFGGLKWDLNGLSRQKPGIWMGFVKFHWANSSGRKLRLKAVKKQTKKDTGAGLGALCSENPPKSFHLRGAPLPFFPSLHAWIFESSCERCTITPHEKGVRVPPSRPCVLPLNPGIVEGMNEGRLNHISLCPGCNLRAAGARKSLRKGEKEGKSGSDRCTRNE